MKRYSLLLAIMILCTPLVYAQTKTYSPVIRYTLDLSDKGRAQFERSRKMMNEEGESYDEQVAQSYLEFSEADPGFACGCSWYCGGSVARISSSSQLPAQGKCTYEAKNLHDFNLNTAWVEDAEGYGIGEWLEYSFSANSARMTKLIIINGYVKNDRAWSENARVKTLELLVNGATRGFLRLKDSAAVQEFTVGPFYPSHEHPAYTVRLVIRDVYPGTKYQDTAISEIDLDGVDVHCVAGDTSIRMAGGGAKTISELAAGDSIEIAKFPGGAVSSASVIRLVKTFHDEVYSYAPDSAHRILVTADHLFIGKFRREVATDSGLKFPAFRR